MGKALKLFLVMIGPVWAGDTGDSDLTVTLLPSKATMDFVWIKPGRFAMGSSASDRWANSDERPLHDVEISQGFYIGTIEVTQRQWSSVMGTKPWSGRKYAQDNPAHPAVYLSWHDVKMFIQTLNPAIKVSPYRLPTEAE